MSYLGLETVKPTKPMKRGDLYSFPVTTVDQIITDEDTNERLPEYLDNLTGMDLLWTNASPTSQFAAQTISLDLIKYRYVLIRYRVNNGGANAIKTEFGIISNDGEKVALTAIWASMAHREATITTSGITFSVCKKITNYNSNDTTDNGFIIPVEIYGIK